MILDGLGRGKLAAKYIFFELLPIFLVGVALFIFIIFMFQSFKLTEYVIVYDAPASLAAKVFVYQCFSYLPIVLPIALLFAVLFIYSRLSGDSEIAALQAVGLSPQELTLPAWALGFIVTFISFQISAHLAPWGSRQSDQLVHEITSNRPPVTIREGVFSEGFFNLVVYANEVDEDSGKLRRVFIFDESRAQIPLTIVAESGEVIVESSHLGKKAFLRLKDGNVHRTEDSVYTKIDFDSFDINLLDPTRHTKRRTDLSSMSFDELSNAFDKAETKKKAAKISLEWHRRITMPVTSFVFALLGVTLGFVTNRRSVRSGSIVICVAIAILYWIVSAGFESLSKEAYLPSFVSAWAPNLIFLTYALKKWLRLHKSS